MSYGNLTLRLEVEEIEQFHVRLRGVERELVEDYSWLWPAWVREVNETRREIMEAEGAYEQPAWEPLADRTRRQKAKLHGTGPFKILRRSGELFSAVTNPDVFMGPYELVMRVDNPYAIYHQSSKPRMKRADGGDRLPRRPFYDLTGREKSRLVVIARQRLYDRARALEKLG